jgi:hypothetical protein
LIGSVVAAEYKLRIRKGEIEFEVVGDKEFVESKTKDLKRLLLSEVETNEAKGHSSAKATRTVLQTASLDTSGIPKSVRDKLERLRDERFFAEPKDSGDVVTELRTRGWGVYKSNRISSRLKTYAPQLGLRRVPLGKNHFGYAYP